MDISLSVEELEKLSRRFYLSPNTSKFGPKVHLPECEKVYTAQGKIRPQWRTLESGQQVCQHKLAHCCFAPFALELRERKDPEAAVELAIFQRYIGRMECGAQLMVEQYQEWRRAHPTADIAVFYDANPVKRNIVRLPDDFWE